MNNTTQPKCIIHCRVSSGKQAQEGESLSVQESICLQIARDRGWALAHEPWLEAFSGRKNARPTFESILDFIDQHPGSVSFYVFRTIDRFTRLGSATYDGMKRELASRGVEMVDSYGVIQPAKNTLADVGFEYDWSWQSPSEITEVVLATTSKQEITTILTRMISQAIRLTQRGFKIGPPDDGYRNAKVYVDGKKRTVQEADPERAKYFETMFELRAAGHLTDPQIVAQVNAMGYRSPLYKRWDCTHQNEIGTRGGNPLSVKRFQEIIHRPIYCGVVWEKWTNWLPVKTPYDGLVSIDVFNRANRGRVFIRETGGGNLELLTDCGPDAQKKLSRTNREFPYKNVVLCPTCKKPFLGSATRSKSGRYVPAYHCARRHKRIGVNKKIFDDAFESFAKRLRFHSDVLTSIRATMMDRRRETQAGILNQVSSIGHNVADLEAQKAQAVQAFKRATSDAMRRELERDAEKFDRQIQAARGVRHDLEVTEEEIDGFIAEVKILMEHPSEWLLNPMNTQQQKAVFALVFTELPTYEEVTSGTPKLRWIFELSSENAAPESVQAGLRGLEWNTIKTTISEWKEFRRFLAPVLGDFQTPEMKAAA